MEWYVFAVFAGAAFLAGLVFAFRASVRIFKRAAISAWGTFGRWLLVLFPLQVLVSAAFLYACMFNTCTKPHMAIEVLYAITSPATVALVFSSAILPLLPHGIVGAALGALAARIYVSLAALTR